MNVQQELSKFGECVRTWAEVLDLMAEHILRDGWKKDTRKTKKTRQSDEPN